jgi:sodium-dependent dicarboxylate transporter 2/3/5
VYAAVLTIPTSLTSEQQCVLALAVLVALLWFSEALPLFVTALLVPVLLVVTTSTDQHEAFAAFSDPILALFFGSFTLSIALARHHLDERIAHLLERFANGSSTRLLFGFIALAALLGMWISNTATVALLLPVALLFIKSFGSVGSGRATHGGRASERSADFAKALLFACAMGAAIGGMATPVGTPPNALAVRYLAEVGVEIGFTQWFMFGLPVTIILGGLAWLVLSRVYGVGAQRLARTKHVIDDAARARWARPQKITVLILLLTVVAWLTESLHGVPSGTIALGAAILLFGSGILRPADLAKVPYQALILFGGGIALGDALVRSGLTEKLVTYVSGSLGSLSPALVLGALMLLAVIITTFASNTASAAFLIPTVLAISSQLNIAPALLVVGTTLALSVDFLTPIGTPPAALIYGTGLIRIKDFFRAGVYVTILALAVIYSISFLLLR